MSKSKKDLHHLYIELTKLQNDLIKTNRKLLLILKDRDTAGKDGTIRMLTKHLSPHWDQNSSLAKPTEREQNSGTSKICPHLPAGGEIVFFNRSWYNRLGVEKSWDFVLKRNITTFFEQVKHFEKTITHSNIIILKYYLDINKEQQNCD